MSAMTDMSKAIRHVLEDEGARDGKGLAGIAPGDLNDMTQIVGAFYLDMKEELVRRENEAVAARGGE